MALTATVGREAELDSIQAFIDAAPRGPSALSISGPAGIGKTILWEAGVGAARDRGFRVLICRGIEAEASLSFAGLSELVNPVFEDVAPALTPPRRRALEVSLLLADPEGATPDPLAIGLAVLDTLRALGANGPCVIAVDDAHWLDVASAMALQFALKRLTSEPIGVLVTVRDSPGAAPPIDLDRCFVDSARRVIRVGPITASALRRLLDDRLSLELGRPELERLYAMTEGNPFFALEVGHEMVRTDTPTTDAGGLRVPENLREVVTGRLARLPTATGEVLLAMSALARPTIDVLVVANGDREVVLDALALAEREGVVRLDDARIRFAHPLHGSIWYQQAPVWKRQSVHRVLADAVADVEERALHLARAADGPDEGVAATLDAAAESAAARGAPTVGAELAELAVTLTPPEDVGQSRQRRYRAATLHRLAGSAARAKTSLQQLLPDVPSGIERADVLLELCRTREFDIPTWLAWCDEALDEAGDDDRRAADILVIRSQALAIKGDVASALVDARAALQKAEAVGDATLIASAIARIGHAETYDAAPTAGLAERGLALERSSKLALDYLTSPRCALARTLMRLGEVDTARSLLQEVTGEASARGDERTRGNILWSVIQLEWLAGRLTTARERGTEAIELYEQLEDVHGVAIRGTRLALVDADLGRVDEARALASQGIASARALSDDLWEIGGLGVLGRIELMLGNLQGAAAILRDLPRRLHDLGIKDPAVPVWPDTLEVLISVGEQDHARAWLDPLEEQALRFDSPLALAATLRCRALLDAADGDAVSAASAFDDSLRSLGDGAYPVERARTLLSMGRFQRQTQQRGAARDTLEQAIAAFDSMEANLWAENARTELARVSGRRPPSEVLTEAERQVAELAGAGGSNREIAASLHMGVSTVESHLSSVYRKLNVKRAELATALAELPT